ncbi:AAA domain (dynein-related subfamily) [Actinopolyspora lacussalsi subsp. righensis]|uniref:AAA domain (Dynein-related subfamily) n=1 Tax=Actinopolyspora righensis TaxID=995060 RepID=A0A1I7BZR4_9ACTN|nr:AAA family ATPase [Actinopolyspora righensis]SFT92672.1 AAA domain (dynein-related subfamily) [Actinopolyspora righensis]
MTVVYADQPAAPEDYLPPAPQSQHSTKPKQLLEATLQRYSEGIDHVVDYLSKIGFVFEPWQVSAFVTAVRTKPFVILAGISGTGKTQLTKLVANATGSRCYTIPVRPDWNDSSDLLGFERIDGSFQPGPLLRIAREATDDPHTQYFVVLDEMNLARVEYYMAEVLSTLEDRSWEEGRTISSSFFPHLAGGEYDVWSSVGLPGNLCLVGSVNMDETTHGFSKKVLDRSFVIEFSKIDLSSIPQAVTEPAQAKRWASQDWCPRAVSLAQHPLVSHPDVPSIIETLIHVNSLLEPAQLQFGYRVRDEIIMFCLAANDCSESFSTSDSGAVDPLDLAIAMKVLPRIQGAGTTVRKVLDNLRSWASPGIDDPAGSTTDTSEPGFPFCSDRIELMLRRLHETGFTNYWL